MIGHEAFQAAHQKIIDAGHHPFAALFLTDHELKQVPGFSDADLKEWRYHFAPFLARKAKDLHSTRGSQNARRALLAVHVAHARVGQ